MFFESGSHLVRTLIVGTLAYAALVFLLRVSGKRILSKWNAFDLVVTVAFGSTLATILLSKDTTLAQGVLGFALLVGLQWCITWLSVRSETIERGVKAQPQLLLFQGEFQRDALRKERVTERELRAALRGQGITAVEDVEAVVLETDGSFSIIKQRGTSTSALADVRGFPPPHSRVSAGLERLDGLKTWRIVGKRGRSACGIVRGTKTVIASISLKLPKRHDRYNRWFNPSFVWDRIPMVCGLFT